MIVASTMLPKRICPRRVLPVLTPFLLSIGLPAFVAAQQSAPASDPAVATVAAPDSPRASLQAYLDAGRAGEWELAGRYLSVPDAESDRRADLAERLKAVLDRHLWFDLTSISASATGRLDDGLPAGVEEVGVLRIDDRPGVSLRLVRVVDEDGDYWAFSQNVVRQVDAWYGTLEGRAIMDWLERQGLSRLLGMGPFDVMWWQWIALLVGAVVTWYVGRLLGHFTHLVLARLASGTANTWDDKLFDGIDRPVSFAWALLLFSGLSHALGLSIPAETLIGHLVRGAAVLTLFWGLWRSVSVGSDLLLSRPWASDNASARTLLTLGGNMLKGVVVALGILALLSAFGYPVTTLLAGLGIGGLALAFGAQKTVENLFGSMALAVDQPFRVGDFVRVQDFVGTVEDIGLRSTRIRTLDRTLVSLPNGSLADQRLESFAARDRMRLATTIGVEYGTTHAQMEQVLAGFQQVLLAHPKIWTEAVIVKFAGFGASSLDIEIMAWFEVPTWGDFQLCRQEVLLGFMRVVEEAGTAFAFPTQTVHLVQDRPAEEDEAARGAE